MQNINFYDPELRLRYDWTGGRAALAAVGLAVVAVAAAGLWMRYQAAALEAAAVAALAADRAQHELVAVVEAQHDRQKTDTRLEKRLLALQATVAQRTASLKMLGQGTVQGDGGYSATLVALARQSVDGLWLTGVSIDDATLTLRGRALQPELIAVYVDRLNGEAALQGRAFRALEIRRPADEPNAASAAPELRPPPSAQPASRRLAAYVEFSLIGAREGGRSDVVDVAVPDNTATRGGGGPQ